MVEILKVVSNSPLFCRLSSVLQIIEVTLDNQSKSLQHLPVRRLNSIFSANLVSAFSSLSLYVNYHHFIINFTISGFPMTCGYWVLVYRRQYKGM